MRKTILTLALSIGLTISYGQDNSKTSIAIVPFSESQDNKNVEKFSPQLISAISATFVDSKRFTVTPTDNWGMPQDASQSQYVDQAKSLGVNYLVTGSIDMVPVTYYNKTDQYGNVIGKTYSAHIVFSIKVISVETGAVFNSKNFDIGSGFLHTVSSGEAVNNAIKHVEPAVKKWIGETFQVNIGLLRIIKKDDKGGALSVLISVGSESGISEGKGRKSRPTKFKIVEYDSETVDGKVMKRAVQIGMAEVDKVDDANFSECIVTEGRMDVAKKVDAGEKLFLITVN